MILGLALCSGIGGLELGLKRAIRGYRCVCHVEREAYAAAVLVARMEEKELDPAPIWDDLESFDSRAWRGKVDLISAGFPCQPWSLAGKRRGEADERWLWSTIAACIRDVRPSFVFLENVPGLVSGGGIGIVLADLAAFGFDAQWGLFRASDVGAPHKRERWFCLAYRDEARLCWERLLRLPEDGEPQSGNDTDGCDAEMADGHGCLPAWPPGPDATEWPEGAPEPAVCGVADGIPDRVDRLRCLGNAVVPAQAELAFRVLAAQIGGE